MNFLIECAADRQPSCSIDPFPLFSSIDTRRVFAGAPDMASADELKALGNKAIADKNFDDAMYASPPSLNSLNSP